MLFHGQFGVALYSLSRSLIITGNSIMVNAKMAFDLSVGFPPASLNQPSSRSAPVVAAEGQ